MANTKPARLVTLLGSMIWVCMLLALAPALPAQQPPVPQNREPFEKVISPFFTQHCYGCHSAAVKTADLNLEAYQTGASIAQHRERWEKILQKLSTGVMPPQPMPRPGDAETQAVVRWIQEEFETADRRMKPAAGRVTARRLNRIEYNNTVRDLLGADLHPADDFPQDDSGYGFDNIGDVLSLSPGLMEKYLAAAEKVARMAVFGVRPLKPTLIRVRGQDREFASSTTPLVEYDTTGLTLPGALHVTHRFPVEGEYVIRAFLRGVRPLGSEPLEMCLWVEGRQVQVQSFDPQGMASFSVDSHDLSGLTQDFRTRITAGDHWLAISVLRVYEGLPLSYKGPNPSKRPVVVREFKPPPEASPERIAELRKRFEAQKAEIAPVNKTQIGSLEVRGPYVQVNGPSAESLKKIYACGHVTGGHQPGCSRTIIASLARRAYRRPVTAPEVDRLVALVSTVQKRGDPFEEGICVALQAMLVSPQFLFRVEASPSASRDKLESTYPISQHDLASRLSYFLWSSMPDDELLAHADRGRLRQPAVLEAQVRRMLADPKSRALAENFGGQWLELRKLESVQPNRKRFPEFDEYLRMSMRRETELFFDSIVREDRSILDFIDGDYTFLNERMAMLYQINGIKGPDFRKVTLAEDTHRGGVVTQASVLTVSSYPTRTSPVLRGKWLLDNFLDDPPPPPLPDVPNLDESKIGTATSLRQELEQHRNNPTCASCHARIDPLGFGLENFDAIGAWRTEEGKFPIDSSGTLPDGRSFRGPQELRAIVKANRQAFAEGVTAKLLTYALGRGLESYDKPAVRKIAGQVAANDYRFSGLVLEIVRSVPFQMRGGESTP